MKYPEPTTIKFEVGGYRFPVQVWNEKNRIFFDFPFNRAIMAEIKEMEGRKFHGYDEVNPRKLWSVPETSRNLFALDFLQGKNPYARYEEPLDPSWVPKTRYHKGKGCEVDLYPHQPSMADHIYRRKGCILACEMGVAKTLSCIIAMERMLTEAGIKPLGDLGRVVYYVSPRTALQATMREFNIWNCKWFPKFLTYEGLTKAMKAWAAGEQAPFILVLDEGSKVKNFQSQRSQAAFQMAEGIRSDWAGKGGVIDMTGTPSPKSPLDWWAQAEICCPGFLKEGDIHKFKNRLAVVIQKEGPAGGAYPEIVAWKDREGICNKCGKGEANDAHDTQLATMQGLDYHTYDPAANEVARLYRRLSGLVYILFKKDCLNLPEKVYRVIRCKPDPKVTRAAKMLLKSSPTVIEGLTRVRELSDGFQYDDERSGDQECPGCHGSGQIKEYEPIDSIPAGVISPEQGENLSESTEISETLISCPNCGGKGTVPTFKRITKSVPCPKDGVLIDLLDEYEDVGRIVIYAGFEGSIERCVATCRGQGWHVIQVNAGQDRVWTPEGVRLPFKLGKAMNDPDMCALDMFQADDIKYEAKIKYPRVAFVAHPGSAGMGLTLTASPAIVYYSNDFNAESRIQSEDRIHRPGMSATLGATIIDILHLDTDYKIMENLKKKRDLMKLTLGDLEGEIGFGLDVEER